MNLNLGLPEIILLACCFVAFVAGLAGVVTYFVIRGVMKSKAHAQCKAAGHAPSH